MNSFLSKIFRRKSRGQKNEALPRINIRHGDTNDLVIDNLILNNPENVKETMVNFGSYTLKPGDCMMLDGPAGCGKSSALCVLKGVWIFGGSGSVSLPYNEQVKLVPQDDYFPDLTLRGIICAPNDPSDFTDAEVKTALQEADLGALISQLDDQGKTGDMWRTSLSGGQKKKVSMASVYLHAPKLKVLILDEITSALDEKSEKELYTKMVAKMVHGIVVSIVHRPQIAALHNIFATVADGQVTYRRDIKGNAPTITALKP